MSGGPRLVIALAVASLLSVFLVYNAVAGGSQLIVSVSQLKADADGAAHKTVQLDGTAISCSPSPCSDSQGAFNFVLQDHHSGQTVPVHYLGGAVPDAFRQGRSVIITGRMDTSGTFVAEQDSLVTKCPSKYTAAPGTGG
ncbi:MAG: cytochrome c maturation protein CcmE domain-containing protein [Gaiellales bacterium]